MSPADRQRLRQAIDRRRRELVADDPDPRCSGCGADLDACSDGCRRCQERNRSRRRRR